MCKGPEASRVIRVAAGAGAVGRGVGDELGELGAEEGAV